MSLVEISIIVGFGIRKKEKKPPASRKTQRNKEINCTALILWSKTKKKITNTISFLLLRYGGLHGGGIAHYNYGDSFICIFSM